MAGKNKKLDILYVDDEPGYLEQGKLFLEREEDRLRIETTTSPKEALEGLEERDFDGIISDYQMSGMNGLELLQVLRQEKGRKVPFIVFTGRGREQVAMKALNLGANRYLQKGGDPKSQYKILARAVVQEAERWCTKKRLQEREEIWRGLLENPLVGVFIIQENCFKRVNSKFCDIFRTEIEQVRDGSYLDLVAQEDQDKVKELVGKREDGQEEPKIFEFTGLKESGETIPIRAYIASATYEEKSSVVGIILESDEENLDN